MDTTGYVYVPASCAAGEECRLHISFHGCLQNYDSVGLAYVREAGYLQWADSNNMIVLFPQTKKIQNGPKNPNGCFDWWGYSLSSSSTSSDDDSASDPLYYTQSGLQMKGFRAMVQRLSGQ